MSYDTSAIHFDAHYNDIVEQTNIYSLQTVHKSIDTNRAKLMSLIGMSIKMGI